MINLNINITPPLAVTIGLLDSFGTIFFSSWIDEGLFEEPYLLFDPCLEL